MKFLALVFTLLLFSCSMETKITTLDNSEISKTELTKKIELLIDNANVTGLAISIFNENKICYKKAFGYANLNKKTPLNTQNTFRMASFSKAVFAYLVCQLVDEGIIDLDIPLQTYLEKPLPEFQFNKKIKGFQDLKDDKRYEQITARMCLTHTTGFPNWRWMNKENDFFAEGKLRFLIEPNTRYIYSGEGINLLQFVIEQITNKNLEELAQERIFVPLKMNNTSYVWQDSFANNYCNGHTNSQEVIPNRMTKQANAAGSLLSTLDDYSKFIEEALKQSSKNSKITSLLFDKNIRIKSKTQFGYSSWQDTDENDAIDLSYALGWGLLKSPYGIGVFKEGHDNGFQHYSIIFPEKQLAIVLLSNSDNAESIFKELLEITIKDTYTPWKWERYIPYNLETEIKRR